MRIRNGFLAADGRPVSMAHHHINTFLTLQDGEASSCVHSCVQEGSDKAMGTASLSSSILDPDKVQCTAMGLNRTTANGSEKALWETREHRREDKGAYRSKGRCIMCGEAGHSCFQQLAMSHAVLPVKYCFSEISGVHPMLQEVEHVESGRRSHSYCNIQEGHPDQIPRSCLKKEPNGKTFTTTIKKRPYNITSLRNDYGISGQISGNLFGRKERKDLTVAGKQTQRKIQRKSHASNERSDSESPNVSPSSGEDLVMSKDSVLQSGMTQSVAGTELGRSVDRKYSNRMFEPKRIAALKNANSSSPLFADLGNGKALLQKLLNKQGHYDQVLDVSNASQNLSAIKSSTIHTKSDPQRDRVLTPASLYNGVAKDEGCGTKSSDCQQGEGCNLESNADQEPAGARDSGHRCKRMDGKGWQCPRKAEAGFSLCEYHLSKFRANHIRKKAAKATNDAMPSKKELSGRKMSENKVLGMTVADAYGVVTDPLPQAFHRQRKPVKARSIMSIQ